ncbi:MAG: hypothetical protein WDW38_000372 [Sanguina aurantia]
MTADRKALKRGHGQASCTGQPQRMFITGTHTPPVRLHTLKTCLHPRYHGPCLDKDRARNSTCKGNRIEMDGEGEDAILTYVAPHHKNEGKGDARPSLSASHPGNCQSCRWPTSRRAKYTMTIEDPHPLLFTTKSGKPFNDSTAHVVGEASVLRGRHATPPPKQGPYHLRGAQHAGARRGRRLLEGAASAMGNTVKQWKQSYSLFRKRRLTQAAVNAMASRQGGIIVGVQSPAPSVHAAGDCVDLTWDTDSEDSR